MKAASAFKDGVEELGGIEDPYEQNYIVALILGISGRHLSDDQERLLKGALSMTNVLKHIVEEAVEKGVQQGVEQGVKQGVQQGYKDVARKMLKKGMDIKDIAELTGLPIEILQEIAKGV